MLLYIIAKHCASILFHENMTTNKQSEMSNPTADVLVMKNWEKVILLMENDPKVTREIIEHKLHLSRSGVAKIIRQLIEDGRIQRIGPDKGGMWEVLKSDEEPEYLFFWGHDPKKLGLEKACFSQWFIRPFTVDNHYYCCMEQYMMSEKARLFKDMETFVKILNESDPAIIKKLGREVRNFKSDVWNEHNMDIVFKGNLAKFSQNEDLKQILLATGKKVLVEASPYDQIWGIGMRECAKAKNHRNWKGLNKLGYTLTRVKRAIMAQMICGDKVDE